MSLVNVELRVKMFLNTTPIAEQNLFSMFPSFSTLIFNKFWGLFYC